MKNDRPADVATALDDLVRGYEEEMQLYRKVRNLAWGQRMALRNGRDLNRFGDLLDEKQDLLRMIAEIESHLRAAKSLVVSRELPQCPNRRKLETLLDELAATIEDTCVIESANAALLNAVPARPAPRAPELVHARA